MSTKNVPIILFFALIIISQLACNLSAVSSATPDTFATLNGLYTASAQTLEAGKTPTSSSSTPGLPLPTATGAPSATAANLPIPPTPVPTSRCDALEFEAAVRAGDFARAAGRRGSRSARGP